jgi:hypothetical protein
MPLKVRESPIDAVVAPAFAETSSVRFGVPSRVRFTVRVLGFE